MGRKRSRQEFAQDGQDQRMGMGSTLSLLKTTKSASNSPEGTPVERPKDACDDDAGGEWETVHRQNKKQKKKKEDSYPAITHASHARLQSFVKIGDLQNLVLYLLADGNAPQWVAVRHHGHIRKAVVLMVPGLEMDMFNGKIDLLDAFSRPAEAAVASVSTAGESELFASAQSREQVAPMANGESANLAAQSDVKRLKISPDDYYPTKLVPEELPEPLKPLADVFSHFWPIKTPGDDKYAPPLVKSKEEKRSKELLPPLEGKHWQNKRTPITAFLATPQELAENGYTLHPAYFGTSEEKELQFARRSEIGQAIGNGWVDTKVLTIESGIVPNEQVEQGSVLSGRRVYAMDCEMCKTSPDVFSLTRVSIVSWDGSLVLDELVKPAEPIIDYLTPYSGITEAMLASVTVTLSDIQAKLVELLDEKSILIGHSLDSDLRALQLTHPFIIDTALLFPHPRGPPLKSSLKWLAQKYLQREIQKGHGSKGHDSIEDARACLDLVKQKCEKGKAWGTSEASGESIFKRLGRTERPKAQKINSAHDEHRTGAVVDWGDPQRGSGGAATVAIGCENDDEVVEGVVRAVRGDADGSLVPPGGVDFVWARFRELEVLRGWCNRTKIIDTAELPTTAISSGSDPASSESDPTTRSATKASLSATLSRTISHITAIHTALPPCTALIVYSGSGDPRELSRLQGVQTQFKQEYKVKKWDELSVQWTDVEEQALKTAAAKARLGCGFVTVK
ncbi:hypothetical protein LTR66_005953 [Elasticomyces elasticus]|nr:hypothetical protein LTR66_005953 [Elasticomyces elasticus]